MIPAYGSCVLGVLVTILVCYVLIVTGRNPTAWANRVVVAPLLEDPFIVSGDDTIGFY